MCLCTLPSESRPMKCSGWPRLAHALDERASRPRRRTARPSAIARVDELGALVEHPAGAERVVADLAVAHVVVAGHARPRCRARAASVASAWRASQSSFGVRASYTASDSSREPMPTPSITHTTTGPGTPPGPCFASFH